MFWILLECCDLRLRPTNSTFQVFPTKYTNNACAATRVQYTIVHTPFKKKNQNCSRRATVVWMSHSSHEPDADDSLRERPGYHCLGCKMANWAFAAISGPVFSCGVRLHIIFGEGGSNNNGQGALQWQEMVGTDEVLFGKHRKRRCLPRNIELHNAQPWTAPPPPLDHSHLDVKAMLLLLDKRRLLRRLTVIILCRNT